MNGAYLCNEIPVAPRWALWIVIVAVLPYLLARGVFGRLL